MSSGPRERFSERVPQLIAIISEETGISRERIALVVSRLFTRMQGRVRKDRDKKRGRSVSDAAVELIVIQYSLEILDSLLKDIGPEELREARRGLGIDERKLLN